MIYLNPEITLEFVDNFWVWFKREFDGSFTLPHMLQPDDILLQSTILGDNFPKGGKSVALCWETYPVTKVLAEKIYACASKCMRRVVFSSLRLNYYKYYGRVDVLPVGVDCNVFEPFNEKEHLRDKYLIPQDRRVGFWSGTTHEVRGYDRLKKYAKENPDIFWILCWKTLSEADPMLGAFNTHEISQDMLAELMNCADFLLVPGRLRPFFLVEWEAMACNLPVVNISDLEKDFNPGENPRDQIFEMKWDRENARLLWEEYLCGVV